MSKNPFSFPVRFVEELNALNFAYKSIHIMSHHSQWYCREQNPCEKGIGFTIEWHKKHMPEANALALQDSKSTCTRFHYLCRFVDIEDNVRYEFVHLHNLCAEWEYTSTEKLKSSSFRDPFGFGYTPKTFKKYTFSHIILYDAYMLKPKRSRSIFSIFARDSEMERPENMTMSFGMEIADLIDSEKSSRLYTEARTLATDAKPFIAAFFGFSMYSHVHNQGGEKTETVSDKTRLLYILDYESLFYRPC